MNDYNEIVHLLSYLRTNQWADSLKDRHGLNKKIIYELMSIQEKVYSIVLIENVECTIKSMKELLEKGGRTNG